MYCHKVTDTSIIQLKNASIAEQSKLYFKLRCKQRLAVQNAWFNQQCLKHKLFPKYVQITCKNSTISAKKAIEAGQTKWLKEEARRWFNRRDTLLLHIKVLHSELSYKLHPIEFDLLDDHTRSKISEIIHKKYQIQLNKLKNLKKSKNSNNKNQLGITQPTQFHKRLINLSDTQFTEKEKNLLENGPKYNPNYNIKNQTEILISEVELSLSKSTNSNLPKEKIKKLLQEHNQNTNRTQNHKQEIKSIQSKLSKNKLVMTKADKGNSIVILKQEDYKEKINQFLRQEKLIKLKKDPTNLIQNKLKSTLKEVNGIFSEKEKFSLINMNPSPPKLYGLIKIHKENSPIRPVVSYTNSPLRQLAVKLNTIFKTITKFEPKYSIKNSIELCNQLKNFNIPDNSILASFDVTNMFSNIPNKECLKIMKNSLEKLNTNPVIKQEIMMLFELCIEENYFQFNNQFLKQKEGLAMGSPLSPLMAEIFMSDFENNFLESQQAKDIVLWYRYVDDILVCFKGDDESLQSTLNSLNGIHPNIKFTLEKEINNKINFLDLSITKDNNKLSFEIFRKPTFTDTTIPNNSCHPNSHKLAAYRSMIHRAFSIPLNKQNLTKELDIIKNIAHNNGFQKKTIDNLIKNKQKQLNLRNIYPHVKNDKKPTFSSLTYFGPISNKIAYILAKDNIKIAFRSPQKLSSLFFNVKDKTHKYKDSGVYKLSCNECNSCYIGQTGRNFDTRFKEHQTSFRLNKENSNFANHFNQTNHIFPDINNLQILHKAQKGRKLTILEAIEIYKHNKNKDITLLNNQTDVQNSTLFGVF